MAWGGCPGAIRPLFVNRAGGGSAPAAAGLTSPPGSSNIEVRGDFLDLMGRASPVEMGRDYHL